MPPATTWLPECSAAVLRTALQRVAPEVAVHPIDVIAPPPGGDEQWHKGVTVVGGQYVVRFAWSRAAAFRLVREAAVLGALAGGPPLPEVVAASTDPALLITRFVPGTSLFEAVGALDRGRAGRQLAEFLAALHSPSALERARAAVGAATGGRLAGPVLPPARTEVLRERVPRFLPPEQRETAVRWCAWAGAVLAAPAPEVLVHGDFHGNNQVWRNGELRLVMDFETVAAADAEYDLRSLPGPGMGPGVELFDAVRHHYARITGRRPSPERVMAWNVRQSLGDVLWRSEAGLPMTDRRTPREWMDDLAARFRLLGLDPGR